MLRRRSFQSDVRTASRRCFSYAPAYQRYGADIMIAHFIGRHKPWYRPRPHPPGPSRGTVPSNDYDTLLSRWHDVYAAHYPSTSQGLSVVHTSRGVEIVERPFVVPTYQAVWDASAARARQFRPGQPEDLKAMFAAGHSAGAEPDDNAMGPAAPGEGRYISMPLEGRISLIGLPPEDDLPQGPSDGQGPQPRELSDPSSTPPKPPSPQDDSPPPSDSPSRPLSPPQVAWNPAMAPPPTGGGPADYQMRNPPDTFYTNAWDQPVPRGATRADHQAAFFRPAPGGTIPHTLQREHFFDNLGSDRPDPRRVKAVFPWEHEEERVRPTRVFPDEPPLVAPGSPRVEESLAAGSRSGYSGAAGSDGSGAASDPTNRPPDAEQVQAHPSYAPPTIHRGLPANLSYTNAWDDVATIGAYADRIAARTAGRASREGRAPPPSSVGAGTGPPSSSAGETQAFGTGAEDSTERRHPNYGYDPDDGDHSRDGDDESSSDSDDDDDQDPESNPPDGTGLPPTSDPSAVAVGERALPIPAPPGGWPRASPGRGYQRKAEAAAVAATGFVPPPRSPRHSRVVSASGLSVASSSSSNAQRTASAVPVGGLIGRRATSGGGGGSAGSGSQTTSPSGTPLARSPTMDMHHPHTSAGAGGGPGSGAGGSWGGRARRG